MILPGALFERNHLVLPPDQISHDTSLLPFPFNLPRLTMRFFFFYLPKLPKHHHSFRLFLTPISLFSLHTSPEVTQITKLINDHPFPHQTLTLDLPPNLFSSPSTVDDILGRLFATHSNGLKALEFFNRCLDHPRYTPTPSAFEKTLHILTRMRYFDRAWELILKIKSLHPSLLTLKSMSIVLSKVAKFGSFEDTLEAFERFETEVFEDIRVFGTEEFNVLIRAFVANREMKEARAVFNRLHSRFLADVKTMNILLLGFKESGDVTAVELFYHEMIKRGFKPNGVTYGIRIDAYCKRGCLGDGLRLLDEMERVGCLVNVETLTTLIHGAGIVRNLRKARELFDGIRARNMEPDVGVYNALLSAFVKCRDVRGALALMDEMEEKGMEHDNMTYHMLFFGLMRLEGVDGVCELYYKMVGQKFVPKTRTVVMLMKFFCTSGRVDLGLDLWSYLLSQGHCPHAHVLDLLTTALCSRGRVVEAFECSKEMLERGRYMNETTFGMLEGEMIRAGQIEKLEVLDEMLKKLQTLLPPSKGHAAGISRDMIAD